jgi:PAS domain S-box-containing protein
MPASGWIRRWRSGYDTRNHASVPGATAATAERLSGSLQLGACALLREAEADRAGVWISGRNSGPSAAGCVVEAEPGPVPEDWKHLDLSVPFMRAVLDSPKPIRADFLSDETRDRVGPLIGMHSAVWIPLRADGYAFGLAMVAYARPPGRMNLDALRARVDEIALGLQNHRNSRRIELASEEMRAQSQLSRAILCGVSADYILWQIARAAQNYCAAEFIALGGGSAQPGTREGWVGTGPWETFLHQKSLVQLCQEVLRGGRESEISGEALAPLPAGPPDVEHTILARVVALPVEGRRETRGVLVAGFSQSEGSVEEFARLESYALLAASALDREAAREARTASMDALRRTVEDKERLKAQMADLVDSIESGVLLADGDGRILLASDRLAAIFGLESRRLLEFGTIHALIDGLAHQFVRPAETAARWREHLGRGEEASWDEFEIARPARKIVERFARPVRTLDGTPLGWLEIYRDITGQRLIQSKLLQTEKMAALGQLVSGIAHELNNPLTSIQGYAQLLLGRRSGPDRASDALRISQEAERAGRIVKNLLLFSREAKSERRAVRLNEVIERTLALRAYELKLENIDVELALDPGLPETLADAAQLQQAVLNLIVNAEQAIVMAREDEVRDGRILIRSERLAGDRLAMHVSDDGPGIAPEIVPHIFDPFFTTKPAGVGTGLGLSIVYGIVQEHGGQIRVSSLPGHGATISIELPAVSVSGCDLKREDTAPERRSTAVVPLALFERRAAKERILIVEDEPTVAELISDVMADEGYSADTLLNSREALSRLDEKSYSLVICDLKMPYLDGPGLYRALVRRENPMQQKLLFVTGDTMAPRTIEFLKSSGLPYLAKPFLVEELKEAVSNALAALRAGEDRGAGPDRSRAAVRES